MCGRFTLGTSADALREFFPLFDELDWQPRYNIAPSQMVAAVRRLPQADRPKFVRLRWGLVPSWADDPKIGNRLINARSETAADKPAFRAAFRQRRCLILADGFYEWQKAAGQKQPYFIHMTDGKPFAFAGLWEQWNKGNAFESCTILTTDANELLRPLHNRMPVILDRAAWEQWLDPAEQQPARLQAVLQPFPSEAMTAYPVGKQVNSPRFDSKECVLPVEVAMEPAKSKEQVNKKEKEKDFPLFES
jgi:putative SOS response-associated peptidase YedK